MTGNSNTKGHIGRAGGQVEGTLIVAVETEFSVRFWTSLTASSKEDCVYNCKTTVLNVITYV